MIARISETITRAVQGKCPLWNTCFAKTLVKSLAFPDPEQIVWQFGRMRHDSELNSKGPRIVLGLWQTQSYQLKVHMAWDE